MAKNKKKTYFITFMLAIIIPLEAQQIENVHFEQEGKIINIYYDLIATTNSEEYTIEVYCSTVCGQSWGEPKPDRYREYVNYVKG
jgi:hypothetical protein